MIGIGLGVAGLIVGVIGLDRVNKNKNKSNTKNSHNINVDNNSSVNVTNNNSHNIYQGKEKGE